MGIFSKKNNIKNQEKPTTVNISNGKIGVKTSADTIYGARTVISDILSSYNGINDLYDKIEFMIANHPDANMAHTNMLRLCYAGGETKFFSYTGKRNKKLEQEWREVCKNINSFSNDGLDGLVNQMHNSILKAGSLNLEVIVDSVADGIKEVSIMHPKYINKIYDKAKGKYIDFQQYQGARVQMTDNANYFSALFDSEIATPKGTLIYQSAVPSIEISWQFMRDLMGVVRRVGFPRNDITVDRKSVIETLVGKARTDNKEMRNELKEYLMMIRDLFNNLEPTQDTLHFDDVTVRNTSSDNSRTIDARAIQEIMDTFILNGLGMQGIFVNRKTGITETYGTVQFEIMLKTVTGIQRISKRAIEYIASIWIATKNFQGYAEYSHNPIDHKSEEQKIDIQIKKQELYRRAEEYKWIDKEKAALEGINSDNIVTDDEDLKLYEYLAHNFTPIVETVTENINVNDNNKNNNETITEENENV